MSEVKITEKGFTEFLDDLEEYARAASDENLQKVLIAGGEALAADVRKLPKPRRNISGITQAYSAYAGRDFRLTKALNPAKSMSFEKLSECISILSQADIQLKSTQNDKRSVLEQTFVKLARAAK